MKALDELRAEHEGIRIMLRVLSVLADSLNEGRQVDPNHLERIMEFITVFVDKCHHAKEEGLLFPALEAAGIPRAGGPVGVMLMEHTEGRSLAGNMADALEDYQSGETVARKVFARNAKRYIALMTAHIEKENNVLYPMGEARLEEDVADKLFEGFAQIERDKIGPGKHDEFHKMLQEFQRRYL